MSTRWLLFQVMSNIPKSWDIYQPLPKTGNTLSREINRLSMQQASKTTKKPLQISSFWFETQAYLSKLLDICQLGIVSLSFTWKVHDAWLANGSKWSPGAGGNWLMVPQRFPYHEQVDEWGFPWWHMIIPNILGTTPDTSFINYIPIFLMITVIPVNIMNPTWMMIESPVQITIHNPQKDRS